MDDAVLVEVRLNCFLFLVASPYVEGFGIFLVKDNAVCADLAVRDLPSDGDKLAWSDPQGVVSRVKNEDFGETTALQVGVLLEDVVAMRVLDDRYLTVAQLASWAVVDATVNDAVRLWRDEEASSCLNVCSQ